MDSLEEPATSTLIKCIYSLRVRQRKSERGECERGIDEARGVAEPLESASGNAHQMGPEAE